MIHLKSVNDNKILFKEEKNFLCLSKKIIPIYPKLEKEKKKEEKQIKAACWCVGIN